MHRVHIFAFTVYFYLSTSLFTCNIYLHCVSVDDTAYQRMVPRYYEMKPWSNGAGQPLMLIDFNRWTGTIVSTPTPQPHPKDSRSPNGRFCCQENSVNGQASRFYWQRADAWNVIFLIFLYISYCYSRIVFLCNHQSSNSKLTIINKWLTVKSMKMNKLFNHNN